MTTLATLHSLIAQGEPETLEFKRSTAELKRASETNQGFGNFGPSSVMCRCGHF